MKNQSKKGMSIGIVCCCSYCRYGCCRHCSSCVRSLTSTYASVSSSVSCRYYRTMLNSWVKAGRWYWASLAMSPMVKGRSLEWVVVGVQQKAFYYHCVWDWVFWLAVGDDWLNISAWSDTLVSPRVLHRGEGFPLGGNYGISRGKFHSDGKFKVDSELDNLVTAIDS